MTGGGGSVSNITQIAARSHHDLQVLNGNDDHLGYGSAAPSHDVITLWSSGLDAAKSATPAVGNVYVATDTLKTYYCQTINVWSFRKNITIDSATLAGALIGYDGTNPLTVNPNTAGFVLIDNGVGQAPSFQSPSVIAPSTIISTDFETATRFSTSANAGVFTCNTFGGQIAAAASGTFLELIYGRPGNNFNEFDGSPSATFVYQLISGALTANQTFMVIGDVPAANGTTTTAKHIGFRIDYSGGTGTLRGTQADGTTENVTGNLLTGLANNDVLNLKVVVTAGVGVKYYYSKNGGAYSVATLNTTNLPTGGGATSSVLSFANGCSAASAITGAWACATYIR